MKIAIIAAMDKEVRLLMELVEDYEEIYLGDSIAYKGHIGRHEVFLSKCGIGKVNAALGTSRVIRYFKPDCVINSGVAGGLDAIMKIGDVLVADRIAYHDVWCGPGTEYGEADGCPLFFRSSKQALDILNRLYSDSDDVKTGLLCSGDKFISSPKEVKEIKSHFPEGLGCDMESAAIAQTCYLSGIDFIVIRVMSDMPGGGENINEYKNFWSEAPARTFNAVSSLIKNL